MDERTRVRTQAPRLPASVVRAGRRGRCGGDPPELVRRVEKPTPPRNSSPHPDLVDARRSSSARLRIVGDIVTDLRAYYDHEATTQRRTTPAGRRADLARHFARLVATEGRSTVLDIGAGPGSDAAAFTRSGLVYVGVDLSSANASLARRRGHDVVAASLFDLPFAPDTFDAGWSMSTLMHVPTVDFDDALQAVIAPFRPGAPLTIGMWGGPEREFDSEPDDHGRRRFFSLRPAVRNQELLGRRATVVDFDTWPHDATGWEYHVAFVRTPDPSA